MTAFRRYSAAWVPYLLLALSICVDFARAARADRIWKALSYNVFYEQTDYSAVLGVVDRVEPDILCLQEVTQGFAAQFVERLGRDYPYRRFEARNGTWGIGVASKHRLSEVSVFEQTPLRMPAMRAVVARGEDRLVAVCVHLWPWIARREPDESFLENMCKNAQLRVQQADTLIRRLASEHLPILLLGDFNEGGGFAAVRRLRDSGFTLACDAPTSACGATYPAATSWWPAIFQVDHVLGRGGVRFHSATVIEEGSSDHYPIVAEFDVVAGSSPGSELR